MSTPSILKKIVATKHQEITLAKAKIALDKLKETARQPRRGFVKALQQIGSNIGVIAEIKKASPSKGVISQNFNPECIAQAYEKAGASCLSVLTDRQYFQGDKNDLLAARNACQLPVLRKDFMVDEYQIVEAAAWGADCILLIMACLSDEMAGRLYDVAADYDLDILIEIHNEDELNRVLKLPKSERNLYGINNRDLNTFTVDLNHSVVLAKQLFDALGESALVVTESGIHTPEDVNFMRQHHIHRFLIGEQFMKTSDAGAALQSLLSKI